MPSILQGGKRPMPMQEAEPAETHTPMGGGGEAKSTLISHGDGRHSIEHEDGSTTEHEHIGHALMHMAGKHSDGVHHHAHSDGMGGGITTHSSSHGGEPEGPNEHEDGESAAQEMKDCMGSGDDEGDGEMEHDSGKSSETKDYE